MKDAIIKWIKSGASLQEAVRLYSIYGTNQYFKRMISLSPEMNQEMLNYQLCEMAGISEKEFKKLKNSGNQNKCLENQNKIADNAKKIADNVNLSTSPAKPKFRDEWSFLNEPGCPHELKILAADKITAWRNYTQTHSKLYSCKNKKQCYDAARTVIDNYKENQLIIKELNYYKKHKKLLGEHAIFAHLKNISRFKSMSIIDLMKKKMNIEHNIWRIHSEINKNTKPSLRTTREKRLRQKQEELAEINKILNFNE